METIAPEKAEADAGQPAHQAGASNDPVGTIAELKRFHSAGRGPWADVSDAEWSDWKWQLRNQLSGDSDLSSHLEKMADSEIEGAKLASDRLATGITPYFFNLIDTSDPECPIRRQVVPRGEEMAVAPWEELDPLSEDKTSPVPGLVHRYPDRVLMLVTDRCASYCRYCTRSRMVSNATGYGFHPRFDDQVEYIRNNPAVRDVLLSGGDPLLLSDAKIERLLSTLHEIPHVEFLRIGSRIPIFLPQRITDSLCKILRRFSPLFVSIHANHPRELTSEVRTALDKLSDSGIPLGNQSVLLKGVNDSVEVMTALVQKLLLCRVKPYYVYQCDLIAGSSHLRASVRRGIEIMDGLRGHTTGYAVPQYVIDAPNGGGKIPIGPEYILGWEGDNIRLRNFEGREFTYPDDPAP